MKICAYCKQGFIPSSNHNKCPRCRYQESKNVLCSNCKVNIHSTKYGSCIHCSNKIRPRYGTGRYVKNGYIMCFSGDHPRCANKRSKNIFEHILVMEKALGRYLFSDENVQHKNGIKMITELRISNYGLSPNPRASELQTQSNGRDRS